MEFLIWIMIFWTSTFLITIFADWLIIGFATPITKKLSYPSEYMLTTKNRFAFQRGTECSGFAAAYTLRSLGIEADGISLYAEMPGKLKNGAVLPKNLKKVLKRHGFQAHYRKGNLKTLKADLSSGQRVIAFIKTRTDKPWLHYVPIVGYDKEHIFIAESMREFINTKHTHYNRKLTNFDFLKLWDTRALYMPFYRNTYIALGTPTPANDE